MPDHDRAPGERALAEPARAPRPAPRVIPEREARQGPGVAAVLELQRAVGNQVVARRIAGERAQGEPGSRIQRHCYEAFKDFAAAKAATAYSQVHLDAQKDDPIGTHERKTFGPVERQNILATNQQRSGRNAIVSDNDPSKVLVPQDVKKTPHVDHRYPKVLGGTNSFKNARVISAKENLEKGGHAGDLAQEPAKALPPYTGLNDANYSILPGALFSADQKQAIYDANRAHYGRLKSDTTAKMLSPFDSSRVPHIDHITPRSAGGCNYYFNAAVLPADENIQKGGVRGAQDDDDDWATGEMSLAEYFERKQAAATGRGTAPGGRSQKGKKHSGGLRFNTTKPY